MKRIAERIKGIRRLRKMTQKALADKSGVSASTISRIEKGGNTDLETINKIENALGTTIL